VIPPRLTVVTVGAREVSRLRAFYKALGWNEAPNSDDGWAAFLLGGVILAIYPLDQLAAEATPGVAPPVGEGWNGITLAVCVDRPEDVDEAFTMAVRAGATAVAEPQQREWGGRSGYVADPEGNRWEIAWTPNQEFDQRGAVVTFWPVDAA
jgi:predicted lactoylglutathione lyase